MSRAEIGPEEFFHKQGNVFSLSIPTQLPPYTLPHTQPRKLPASARSEILEIPQLAVLSRGEGKVIRLG